MKKLNLKMNFNHLLRNNVNYGWIVFLGSDCHKRSFNMTPIVKPLNRKQFGTMHLSLEAVLS